MLWTLISCGLRGKLGPFPFLSMNFFRSVLRYSKTCVQLGQLVSCLLAAALLKRHIELEMLSILTR